MDNAAQIEPPGLWSVFTAAPHRMMFFGGVFQLVSTLWFWSVELAGRYSGLWPPLQTSVPTTWAHAFLMLYGLFLFFIFGFLMTTYPRWMNGPLVERRHYIATFLLLFAGVNIFYIGLFVAREVVAAGVTVFLLGWWIGIYALFRVYRLAPAKDKRYERWLNIAHLLGWLGAACFLLWLFIPNYALLKLSLRVGLWLFLIPVFVTVAHRMVPFFSYCVLPDYEQVQPNWSLPVLWLGLAIHAALEFFNLIAWTWLVDLPLAGIVFWHVFAWKIHRSFQIRLLAVLHIAVFMLGVSLAFTGIRSLLLAMTGIDFLGLGPQHVLAIGFLAAMVVGMVTRVSLGHSGRELVMDTYNWVCFWGMIAAGILRASGELALFDNMVVLNLAAAGVWLLFAILWVARFIPIYLQPRIDGKPG